jgi:hypothetical protein
VDSTKVLDNVFTANERESMTIVEVDPGELLVDWTVNEAHVQEIINSLPAHKGQIVFPPYVCLHNRKIIDGLHRVVAAHRAGIGKIRIVLVDLAESRFWDLRIMAAKPHHSIENSRLYEWMEKSWETDWGHRTNAKEEIAAHLWQMFRGENYRQSQSLYAKLDRSKLVGEQAELYDWFAAKSVVWNIPVESLADRILSFWNVVPPRPELDQLAGEYALTLPERNRLQDEARRTPAKPTYVKKWVDAGMPDTLLEFAKKEKAQKVERKKRDRAREEQKAATPIGQEQLHRRHFATVRDAINRAGEEVARVAALFPQVPESAAMLATHLERVRTYAQDIIDVQPDAIEKVLADNARLYRENSELRIKVASLERATGKNTEISSNVLAWSSLEISRQKQ